MRIKSTLTTIVIGLSVSWAAHGQTERITREFEMIQSSVGRASANTDTARRLTSSIVITDAGVGPSAANVSATKAMGAAATPSGIVYTCDPAYTPNVCDTLNTTIAGLYSAALTNASASIYVKPGTTSLGSSQFLALNADYSDFQAALMASAEGTDDATAMASSVPSTNPLSAGAVLVTVPLMNALGMTPTSGSLRGISVTGTQCVFDSSPGCYNGVITVSGTLFSAGQFYFRTGQIAANQYDFYTVIEHETDEILGTISCAFGCSNNAIAPSDLFRYQSSGGRSFSPGNNDNCVSPVVGNACFSLDGVQMLQHFNNLNNGQDAGDWAPSCPFMLVQNSASCIGIPNIDISPGAEIRLLDAIGYTRTANVISPVAAVTTAVGELVGTCTTPPAQTDFSPTGGYLSVYVSVTGAQIGGHFTTTVFRPDGVVYTTYNQPVFNPNPVNGSFCFLVFMPVAGELAEFYRGQWKVLVSWNDSQTPLFVLDFNIVGPPCTYSFAYTSELMSSTGGTGMFDVVSPDFCPWTLSALPSWVSSPYTQSGSGTSAGIPFSVMANTGPLRVGTVTLSDPAGPVPGAAFTIVQPSASIPGLSFVGSMPHLAAKDGWQTTFTLVNKDSASATARLKFFDNYADQLALPMDLPQQAATANPVLAATVDENLAPASVFVGQAIDQTGLFTFAVEGSAQLFATSTSIDGFAIFHYDPTSQEAVVPLETRNAATYLLPFDNTNGVSTGIAVTNVSSFSAPIPVTIRNDKGAVVVTGSLLGSLNLIPPVASLGADWHTSFVLSSAFPETANLRGTVEIDTPAGGQISALGIRYTPPGTLTTIPALANIGTTGGKLAHLAVDHGWQTSFVLVNTGANPATATLSFFDDNGSPLPLPLTFPQGVVLPQTTSTLAQTIPPQASLWAQSSGASPNGSVAHTGSAVLTTNGAIGGFAIFRYNTNGQEAVVPIESRNAASYLLAFDNTAGTATGVAISNASAQAITVPVTVRDGTGLTLATGSIPLSPHGHTSFVLSAQFPQSAGILGTAEFSPPAGATIGVLGIRSPPALTFTTLPALTK